MLNSTITMDTPQLYGESQISLVAKGYMRLLHYVWLDVKMKRFYIFRIESP